jgi:hypothetical protein
MKRYTLVRTIYLYIFALLGLVLLIIGSVNFLNMGLKAFIFTQADEESRIFSKQIPIPTISRIENIEQDIEEGKDICLSKEEKISIESWLADYNNWKESVSKIDPITSRRHRDASINLSLILIGLPLYLYHWRIIKKETEEKEKKVNEDED